MDGIETNPEVDPQRRRKRVVAREVESENLSASHLAEGVVIPDPPPPVLDAPPAKPGVIDPADLGRRKRRQTHHRLYRFAQVATLIALASGAACIVFAISEDTFAAHLSAGVGIVCGLAATAAAGQTGLSNRVKGWAIAATVFAAASLGVAVWLHHLAADDSASGRSPRSKMVEKD